VSPPPDVEIEPASGGPTAAGGPPARARRCPT